jgi:tetratricopeptide (TPR) repeat protein
MRCGWRGGLVACFIFLASHALAQDAVLERARALIQASQGAAAYRLLAPLEQQRAGEVEYDYLLGLAGLDAGQYTSAVFALERVLAMRPDHPQARAEIARAYFLMGENRAARHEFEAVKRAGPPEAVALTIDQFLNALDARERSRGAGFSAFFEAGIGIDSNVNSASATSSFAIPLFPGLQFNLAPSARKQEDQFIALAGGSTTGEASLQALDELPVDTVAAIGFRLWQKERFSAAVAVNQRLVARTPRAAENWANLGVSLQSLERCATRPGDRTKPILALHPQYRNVAGVHALGSLGR